MRVAFSEMHLSFIPAIVQRPEKVLHFDIVKSSFSVFLSEPELLEYYQIIVIPVAMCVFRERSAIKESISKIINSVIIAFYGCLCIESVVDLVSMMLPVQMKRIIPNAQNTKSDPICGEGGR
ncbi:hypothetical protein [Acetobacter indonesiensis]